MIQTLQTKNEAKSESVLCDFPDLTYLAPVCFGFRNSNFGFYFAAI